MKKEIWKNIENYEGLYQVSNFGKVRSVKRKVKGLNGIEQVFKGRILIPENIKGYHRVTLSKKNKQTRQLVHRIVAVCFISNIEEKRCVNHIDGNRFNNNVSNLEWCTHSENEKHSYNVLGKVNSIRKLKDIDAKDIRQNAIKRVNIDFFMDKYSVSRKTVLNVLNKKYYV